MRKKAALRYGKTDKELKTCNLFCNIAVKRVEMRRRAFYQSPSNMSCNKSGCCKLRKLLQKIESYSTFCNKICTCCVFYQPKANLYGVTPA